MDLFSILHEKCLFNCTQFYHFVKTLSLFLFLSLKQVSTNTIFNKLFTWFVVVSILSLLFVYVSCVAGAYTTVYSLGYIVFGKFALYIGYKLHIVQSREYRVHMCDVYCQCITYEYIFVWLCSKCIQYERTFLASLPSLQPSLFFKRFAKIVTCLQKTYSLKCDLTSLFRFDVMCLFKSLSNW